jgi:hypothetical protein
MVEQLLFSLIRTSPLLSFVPVYLHLCVPVYPR